MDVFQRSEKGDTIHESIFDIPAIELAGISRDELAIKKRARNALLFFSFACCSALLAISLRRGEQLPEKRGESHIQHINKILGRERVRANHRAPFDAEFDAERAANEAATLVRLGGGALLAFSPRFPGARQK